MTKEDVLALLEKSDAPVSGEQMCRALGMTRAGVWKAIEALRADGFDIEAAPRRGYRLCAKPLQKQALERLLDGRFPADRLIVLPEVDSTNTYLKQLASNGAPDETAVLSIRQTAGRGRRGRSFLSEPGGLYLSYLIRPHESAQELLHLTALAGLCVCNAVRQVTGMQPSIKWPNDPVLNGKKLCGILTELSVSLETQEPEYVVIGIGINCNQTQFPQELDMATSLRIEAGRPADVNAIGAASGAFADAAGVFEQEVRLDCRILAKLPDRRQGHPDSARRHGPAGKSNRHRSGCGASGGVPGRHKRQRLFRRGVGAGALRVCLIAKGHLLFGTRNFLKGVFP